jgi:hypothetical protein
MLDDQVAAEAVLRGLSELLRHQLGRVDHDFGAAHHEVRDGKV